MKTFEYYHRDIKQLKKDIAFRCLFSLMFLISFVWQIISMIVISVQSKLSVLQGAVGAIVLICAILLCLVTLSFCFKDFRIIATIKMNGKCLSSVGVLFSTSKTSFMKLYDYLIKFLTLMTTLVLIACITYSILQISYLSTISYYMPMLLLVCFAGYNSIYHIKDEILTQNTVQQQQSYV